MRVTTGKTLEKKKSAGLCAVAFCTRKRRKGRILCHCHTHQRQKENNPILYTFKYYRQNANSRKIPWEITLEEWRKFCLDTKFLQLKGKTGQSASLDRKKAYDENGRRMPYKIGNIQVLTLSGNSRKKYVDERLYEKYGAGLMLSEEEAEKLKSDIAKIQADNDHYLNNGSVHIDFTF